MTPIEVGKTYEIHHSRKGKFVGTITSMDDEWADVAIVDGRAGAMLAHNEREAGETVTVRRAFCTFTPAGAA